MDNVINLPPLRPQLSEAGLDVYEAAFRLIVAVEELRHPDESIEPLRDGTGHYGGPVPSDVSDVVTTGGPSANQDGRSDESGR